MRFVCKSKLHHLVNNIQYNCTGNPGKRRESLLELGHWYVYTGKISPVDFFQHWTCFYLPFIIKIESLFYTKVILKTVKLTKTYWISGRGIYHQNADLHGKPEGQNHSTQNNLAFSSNPLSEAKTNYVHVSEYVTKTKKTNASLHCEANQRKCLYSGLAHYFAESETFEEFLKYLSINI